MCVCVCVCVCSCTLCLLLYHHPLLKVFKISDGQLTVNSPTPSQPSAVNSSPKQEDLSTAVPETEEPTESEEKMEVDAKPEGCAKFVPLLNVLSSFCAHPSLCRAICL